MPYKEPEEQQISKYNQGLPQLFRLDNLWQKFNYHVLKGNLDMSNWVLDRVWGELSADSTDADETEIKGFVEKIEKNKKDGPKLYGIIMAKETFLRKLQNKQGKGTAYLNPEDEDLD